MEPVGLALAILATVDICLKYGDKLAEACRTYRNADIVIQERALRVEVCWKRTRDQIKYVRQVHEDFDPELIYLQSRMFDVLESKLKTLNRTFDKLHNEQLGLHKWRVVTVKGNLDEAIAELEGWQSLFDPSWKIILTMASRTLVGDGRKATIGATVPKDDAKTVESICRVLNNTSKSPFFEHDPLTSAKRSQVLHSPAGIACEPREGKSYIVESRSCHWDSSVNAVTKDVRAIATRLQSVDPSKYSMLQCKGVIRKVSHNQVTTFELVFRPPQKLFNPPQSFRSLLGRCSEHSLTERLFVAQQLGRAVCYIHTLDFVHKNIRPESILSFEKLGTSLGVPFLVGFQRFRTVDGRTQLREQSNWNIDLYRHPDRHGENPTGPYIMQHDMYSLGVCLLEIGLWSSFVEYDVDDNTSTPGSIFGVAPDFFQDAKAVKEKLVAMGKELLPSRMGNKFASVVVDCLTCLDPDNQNFANHAEFEDSDGILIGVKYITKILLQLESISL